MNEVFRPGGAEAWEEPGSPSRPADPAPGQGATEVRYEQEGAACNISVLAGGQPVSRLRVIEYDMRLAGAWVKMGGIADVVTHPLHRGQGYAARLLRATVEWMHEQRYPISILFGISNC